MPDPMPQHPFPQANKTRRRPPRGQRAASACASATRSSATRSSLLQRGHSANAAITTPRSTTSPPASRSPSPHSIYMCRARRPSCSSASGPASTQIQATLEECEKRRRPGARAAVRLHPRLCRGHCRRLRMVHAARRGPAPGRGHEPPHQTTEGGHRPAHARAHRGRRRRRLDPRLRHEDDGVRARRRAQLDGTLVSRGRDAQARERSPIDSSMCSIAASAAAIDGEVSWTTNTSVIVAAIAHSHRRLPGRARAASPRRSSAPPPSRAHSPPRALPASDVQEVIMGCVLPAGLGQAPGAPGRARRRHSRRACPPPPSTRCAARA